MPLDSTPAQSERLIPNIDLRRIVLYGPCTAPHPTTYQPTGEPCSPTSLRDDVHFPSCPQAQHSRSGIVLGRR